MPAVPTDVVLHPLRGKERTLAEQVGLFHLVTVVLDPYTYESSWLLDTATRILHNFRGADCRTAFTLTCDAKGAREFLGPLTEEYLVFTDPDRSFVKALGLSELPAFVHIDQEGAIVGVAEGWDPETWRPIAEQIAEVMSWSRPVIPQAGDPVPYRGTPAVV